jgi:hypothetical protein
VAAGVVNVRINVASASHDYAELAAGETDFLNSAATGLARILWKESGTGIKWATVSLETVFSGGSRFIEFELDANLASGSATATVLDYSDGVDPGPTLTVYDPRGLFVRGLTDAKGVAFYDARDGRWEVIECQSKAGWILFTLTGNVSSGAATATVNDYGGSQQDVQNPGSSVTVYDDANLFFRALAGAVGEGVYDAIEDKYRILCCQTKAKEIHFSLASTLAASDTSQPNCSVDASYQGQSPGGTVTIYNTCGMFAGPAGTCGMAQYDDVSDKYWIKQLKCT